MLKDVYQCSLVPEDFLWFVSGEFNTLTDMQPVIHNYALTFALANNFQMASLNNIPDYSVIETMSNYATPASPLRQLDFATHTYNSVCSKTNLTQSILNTPALGRNRKISPASAEFSFLVFSTGDSIRNYVRVGKKSCIVKINTKKLSIIETIEQPTTTIDVDIYYNLNDISPNDVVSKADILMMYPTPITRSMKIKAPYVVLESDTGKLTVPIPRHLRRSVNE